METRRDVFQAIADPTRRAILVLIASQAMTPNALAEHFESLPADVFQTLLVFPFMFADEF